MAEVDFYKEADRILVYLYKFKKSIPRIKLTKLLAGDLEVIFLKGHNTALKKSITEITKEK